VAQHAVEADRGLVENEQLGFSQQRGGKRDARSLSA
jgi:hypothetical protein